MRADATLADGSPPRDATGLGDAYPLFELVPALRGRLQRFPLGVYPTPVTAMPALGDVFVKREDISAEGYGGNKIRPLELVFGDALARGARRLWSTGSLGSNHALATAVHAPRAGLDSGAVLFPQPSSATARDNLRAVYSLGCRVHALRTIAAFPFDVAAIVVASRLARRGDVVQAPGAATPLGALGHLSAGLELALQIDAKVLPEPRHLVVPVGSTCTTAGLLVALELARHLGLAFRTGVPRVHAVRVTPWPVTDPRRVAWLAVKTAATLAELGGPELGLSTGDFLQRLDLRPDYLGGGYGNPTIGGLHAIARFEDLGGPPLDTTYSGKAGAFLLDLVPRAEGPVLFWATKSSVPLPATVPDRVAEAPRWVRRWLHEH